MLAIAQPGAFFWQVNILYGVEHDRNRSCVRGPDVKEKSSIPEPS
jgi:hypothetical protein